MEVNALNKQDFLFGGGEAGQLVLSMNWSANPAGTPTNWPPSLRTTINIILQSHVPMFIVWGPSGILFLNDASQALIGLSAKEAMGHSAQTIFADKWETLGPAYEHTLQGKGVTLSDVRVTVRHEGYSQIKSFTFSCIPLLNETGGAGGMLVTASENPAHLVTDHKKIYDVLLQLPLGILVVRMPGYVIELANDAYVQMTGRQTIELDPSLLSLINQVISTGKTYLENALPMQVVRNGRLSQGYFNYLIYPLQQPDGTTDGVMLVGREVTDYELERKRMERSEHYFRRLADMVPVMLYLTRPDGQCTYVNKNWYDFTGKTTEQTLGNEWLSVVHPEDIGPMSQLFLDANAYHRPYNLEYRIKGKDDKYRWILDSGSPMFDKQGGFEGFIGSVVNIDQRKKAEDDVRKSEQRFRQLADSMPQIVWTANADGYVDYYNKQWLRLISDSGELGMESFVPYIHPDDQQRSLEAWRNVVRTGEPYEIEYRFKVKYPAQGFQWFLVRALPIRNDNGDIVKWYGTCTDIDEVKRIEHTLRESEQRFRLLVDAAPVMVWMSDPNKQITFLNKRWTEFTGRPMQLELWEGYKGGILPEDFKAIWPVYEEALSTRREFEVEFRLKRYDDEYRWVICHGIPRYSYDGSFLGYIGSTIDIHERKTAGLELENRVAERTHTLKEINLQLEQRNELFRQSEERYLRMTNEVEDYAIILLSKDGYIENWNKGAEKIKGYTSEEITGKHFRVFYPTADRQDGLPEKLIAEASRKGKATYEGLRVRKDGSTFWANTVITALHDDKDDIIGFSKVTRDLTERKMVEDQLTMYADQMEQKNRELERSNSELSSFSYVASHDLQEPLRKIQTFGNLIQAKDAANLSDTSKDYFDRMVKAAVRMQNLIDSLLEFSRTTTARKNFEVTDLNVLLEDVKKELAHRIEEQKATINAQALPTMSIIPFQFRQLAANLISNSLKYAREAVPPVVDITTTFIKAADMNDKSALPGKDYYLFTVADNGIGFEMEYAEKIFELFQRLHGRNEYSGSGIGLAICKKIVENHHGFMRAEGEPDRGATFYFYIPILNA